MKFNASAPLLEVYINGSSVYAGTGSSSAYGGVAFGGDKPKFDNLKVGYDNNNDDDIDDAGDDVVINETFTSTSVTPGYDHAGNLIDDGNFQYVYDAWNRLVKVRSDGDTDVTFQTAEFFADGRRARKDVSNSGEYDTAEVYLYDGQKIIETRDGSNYVKKQFVHGTQYIDELLMIRVYEKGDFYVHQDANWNVIMLNDLRSNTGGKVAERYVYTPYGEVVVHQEDSWGDRDGDDDVDSTDKGTVGVTCTGTVTGSCRILDLDFDGDHDSTDATSFDSLPQGFAKYPGRFASGVSQPFHHQGLYYEPETGQYQNRAREYHQVQKRFSQRDPMNVFQRNFRSSSAAETYVYLGNSPVQRRDPHGLDWVHHEECHPGSQDGPLGWSVCNLNPSGGTYCRPCANITRYPPGSSTHADTALNCIYAHEAQHCAQCMAPECDCCREVECGPSGGCPYFADAECAAYMVSQDCLDTAETQGVGYPCLRCNNFCLLLWNCMSAPRGLGMDAWLEASHQAGAACMAQCTQSGQCP